MKVSDLDRRALKRRTYHADLFTTDDRPRYLRGNRILLSLNCINIGLYVFTKVYYVLRNKQRDRIWNAMSIEERAHYLATTTDKGNKRLDFRFAS